MERTEVLGLAGTLLGLGYFFAIDLIGHSPTPIDFVILFLMFIATGTFVVKRILKFVAKRSNRPPP
jgi:F0F1-type ATP synthase assembly protein I